jgi:hypothetical protein
LLCRECGPGRFLMVPGFFISYMLNGIVSPFAKWRHGYLSLSYCLMVGLDMRMKCFGKDDKKKYEKHLVLLPHM